MAPTTNSQNGSTPKPGMRNADRRAFSLYAEIYMKSAGGRSTN